MFCSPPIELEATIAWIYMYMYVAGAQDYYMRAAIKLKTERADSTQQLESFLCLSLVIKNEVKPSMSLFKVLS